MTLRALALSALAFLVLGAPPARADEDNPLLPKRSFKNAVVTYKVAGQFQNGTEVRYVDGDRMRNEQSFSSAPAASGAPAAGKDSVELILPDFIYRWEKGAKEGRKSKNPQQSVLAKYRALPEAEKAKFRANAEKFADRLYAGLGPQAADVKRTKGKILGYECEQIEIASIKTCLWKDGGNLPLKIDRGAFYSSEATKVELDKGVPAEKFAPPADVVFTAKPEDEQMVDRMADMMFKMIQSGEQPKLPAFPADMMKKPATPPPAAGAPPPAPAKQP